MREVKELGMFVPGEWIAPIVQFVPEERRITRFCGTAVLLGGDFFLTARHVMPPSGAEPRPHLAIADLSDPENIRYVFVQLVGAEFAPGGSDLAIGRLDAWAAERQFVGVGFAAPLSDVVCVGYPEDLVRPVERGDMDALDNPRYLKGYVTRFLEPSAAAALVKDPSLELSFPISRGMSGSPVWGMATGTPGHEDDRVLIGIATHTVDSRIVTWEEVVEGAGGGHPVRTETARVVETGIAVRLSALEDWRPRLSGVPLGAIIAGEV